MKTTVSLKKILSFMKTGTVNFKRIRRHLTLVKLSTS